MAINPIPVSDERRVTSSLRIDLFETSFQFLPDGISQETVIMTHSKEIAFSFASCFSSFFTSTFDALQSNHSGRALGPMNIETYFPLFMDSRSTPSDNAIVFER